MILSVFEGNTTIFAGDIGRAALLDVCVKGNKLHYTMAFKTRRELQDYACRTGHACLGSRKPNRKSREAGDNDNLPGLGLSSISDIFLKEE